MGLVKLALLTYMKVQTRTFGCRKWQKNNKSLKEALGMFRLRTNRVWRHAAIFAWGDLILDRSHKVVGLQSPTAYTTRAGGDSDPYFENCDLFFPDIGRDVHARSWRANRDIDVKR